ncbi:MAG: hypothetical protein MZV70_36255 [Desulfobacterales bacterium]|nr:hypothetical protein [Desulfobacterales bacterium]
MRANELRLDISEDEQSRLTYAIGEMVSPRSRVIADPLFFEATDAVEKFMDIKFENIRKGWAGLSDLGRMPFWNEKMKNVSNAMLDMEGVGSRITEGLFKTSKPFFTMSKAGEGQGSSSARARGHGRIVGD